MELNLESVKRMLSTGRIYHHLDCRYGGSDSPEIKHEYCRGYIDAVYNHNLITPEVRRILNRWNDLRKEQAK